MTELTLRQYQAMLALAHSSGKMGPNFDLVSCISLRALGLLTDMGDGDWAFTARGAQELLALADKLRTCAGVGAATAELSSLRSSVALLVHAKGGRIVVTKDAQMVLPRLVLQIEQGLEDEIIYKTFVSSDGATSSEPEKADD